MRARSAKSFSPPRDPNQAALTQLGVERITSAAQSSSSSGAKGPAVALNNYHEGRKGGREGLSYCLLGSRRIRTRSLCGVRQTLRTLGRPWTIDANRPRGDYCTLIFLRPWVAGKSSNCCAMVPALKFR